MSNPADNQPELTPHGDVSRAAKPLAGLKIVVTRPVGQSRQLVDLLNGLGADVESVPLIRIEDPPDNAAIDRAIETIDEFDWIVFTSANGASRFLDRAISSGVPADRLSRLKIAAVGPATVRAATERGARVSLVPERFVAESLADAFRESGSLAGVRMLIARAIVASDRLPNALREAGAVVETVDVYQTLPDADKAVHLADLIDRNEVDIVIFASGSAVDAFARVRSQPSGPPVRIACIGPVTAATARRNGLDVWVEAAEHTDEGLILAITESVIHSKS